MRRLVIAGALLVAAAAAHAQPAPPPIATDRPDQTESAFLVPRGFVQLEFGGLHAADDAGAGSTLRALNVGNALLRMGVLERVELRLGFVGWQRVSGDGLSAFNGFGDLAAGAKLRLVRGGGAVPTIALLGMVTLPVGDAAFRADGVDPFVKAAFAQDLGNGFGLGYNVGAIWTTETDGSGDERLRTDLAYSVAIGRGLTDRLAAFVEGYGVVGVSAGRASWRALDGGFVFALRPNVQLDLSGGVGLNEAATDWFLSGGVSVRVPR
ncbi:MAG: transporter [Gemmatimonadota bacterium]|nr:transporter [Gemmatimonadota bacterium]